MAFTKDDIIGALKTVYDPEIPVNIWDMGLVYDIDIADTSVNIKMTFTSPTCPMMEDILNQVKNAVAQVVAPVAGNLELVRGPAWDLSRMSDAARIELDLTNSGW